MGQCQAAGRPIESGRMIIRAIIVLLVVLNLGVAAWWLLHDAPPQAVVAQPTGVPRLQLLDETASSPGAAGQVQAQAQAEARSPAAAPARAAIAMPAGCQGPAEAGDSWRVYLSDPGSPEAAQAMGERIGAAGFSDFLVMREGEANSIALGLFSTLEGAQRRVESLQAKGFPARCARIAASTPA